MVPVVEPEPTYVPYACYKYQQCIHTSRLRATSYSLY